MKRIIFICLLAFNNITAQTLPEINVEPIAISQGTESGFVMLIPNADINFVLKEWEAFTYGMFPPIAPGEDQPRFPKTIERDAKANEYSTIDVYIPHLSQHTVDIYFTLTKVENNSIKPSTKIAIAIDYGNDHFVEGSNFFQIEMIKHLLQKFYIRMDANLNNPTKKSP